MLRRLPPLLLVAACASKGGEGARGQGEKEVVVPPAPAGDAWRTARGAPWKDVLEDLAGADVAFVAADDGMRLPVLQYLFDRGRLHAIGIEEFPRTAQKALDDFSFGRIDEAELAQRCGPWPAGLAPVLAFARERRLPVLGLGLEQEIVAAVAGGGLEALSEEQRLSLPATKPEGTGVIGGGDASAAERAAVVRGLLLDVAADVVVRWYRDAAPEGAQVVILAASPFIAPRSGLPERLFARSGKTYRTLVALPGTAATADPAVFARAHADYVWFTGAK